MKKTIIISKIIYTFIYPLVAYTCIFFGLTTNLNTFSCFKLTTKKSEECELQKLINEKFEEAEKLNSLCDKDLEKNKNSEKYEDVEKHEDVEKSEEVEKKMLKILNDYIAYQTIDLEKRYKGCVILAQTEISKKNYVKAKQLIDVVLYLSDTKFLTINLMAEALSVKSKILCSLLNMIEHKTDENNKDLIKLNNKFIKKMEKHLKRKIDNEELKNLYVKYIASCSEKIMKIFKICSKLEDNPTQIAYYEEKALNSSLDAANYALKYIASNKNLNDEKHNKYLNFAEKLFQEIIDYINKKELALEKKDDKKTQLAPDIILKKAYVLTSLAEVYLFKKNSTESEEKIKNMFQQAISLIMQNRELLEITYEKNIINDTLKRALINIIEMDK